MEINTNILSIDDIRKKIIKRHKWTDPIACSIFILLVVITIVIGLGFVFILVVSLFPWKNMQNQWLGLGFLAVLVMMYTIMLKVEFTTLKSFKKDFEKELANPKIWGYPRVMISKNTTVLIPTNYNVALEGSKFILSKLGQDKEQIVVDEPTSIFIIGKIYEGEDSEFWMQLNTQDTEVIISSLKHFSVKGEKYLVIEEKISIGFD
jgi:hypothetical protein